MEPSKLSKKAHSILAALTAGRSCEEILAADRTLTYHDIFHAVTEAPTSHWNKGSAGTTGPRPPRPAGLTRALVRQRSD